MFDLITAKNETHAERRPDDRASFERASLDRAIIVGAAGGRMFASNSIGKDRSREPTQEDTDKPRVLRFPR